MCASSNIRTTTHARGITSGYQSINGPSNHASLRTQHTRRMCPQARTFPGPVFRFGGMVIAVYFFSNLAVRRTETDKVRPFLAAASACYTSTTRCTSASSLRWLANLPGFPSIHVASRRRSIHDWTRFSKKWCLQTPTSRWWTPGDRTTLRQMMPTCLVPHLRRKPDARRRPTALAASAAAEELEGKSRPTG